MDTFLLFSTLFNLNFCLSFCYIQWVDNVGERFVNGVVLEHSAVSADSHVDGNGVASRVLPVRNTWRYFKVLHVLLRQLPWRRTMKRRRRRPSPRRQLPMFMQSRQQGIHLYSINPDNPFLGAIPIGLRSKPNHLRLSSPQLLNIGPKSSLFLNS